MSPEEVPSPSETMRRRTTWCCAFAVALIVYAGTANPGPQSQDSGWQQYRIVTRQLDHPAGLALCHPLHHYLGRAAVKVGFLEPAYAITLVSSVAAAVAIANVTLLIVLLTRRVASACIAAGALLVSHTFWQHATYTESYALVAALLSGEWLCLAYFVTTGKARYLPLLALLNGLGIANHLLALLATPVDFVVIVWAWRRGHVSGRLAIAAAMLWLAATSPYTGLVLARGLQSHDMWGAIDSALFAGYTGRVLNIRVGGGTILRSLGYVIYNFPGLTVPLALVGLAARDSLPKAIKRPLLAQLGLYLLFVVRYTIADQYSFFFPAYMLLAIFAGCGLAKASSSGVPLLRRSVLILAAVTAAWTPLVYLATARVLAARGALAGMVQNKPYRDGYRAFFVPWGRGADAARKVNSAVRELAGADGLVLIADHMQLFALRYAQELGRIPETVEILYIKPTEPPERVAGLRTKLNTAIQDGRAVVLVPLNRDEPRTCVPEAHWIRLGDIYQLSSLAGPTSGPGGSEPTGR